MLIKSRNSSPLASSFGGAMPGRSYNLNNYRYNYQGQERADNSNWQNFELRMHNPDLGRWMSPDPYGQFFSPYVSMGNDPISGTDPDGGLTNAGQTPSWESINNGNRILEREERERAMEMADKYTMEKFHKKEREIYGQYYNHSAGGLDWEGSRLYVALKKEFGLWQDPNALSEQPTQLTWQQQNELVAEQNTIAHWAEVGERWTEESKVRMKREKLEKDLKPMVSTLDENTSELLALDDIMKKKESQVNSDGEEILSQVLMLGRTVVNPAAIVAGIVGYVAYAVVDEFVGFGNSKDWVETREHPSQNPIHSPPNGFDPEKPTNGGGAAKWIVAGKLSYEIYDEYNSHVNKYPKPNTAVRDNTRVVPYQFVPFIPKK